MGTVKCIGILTSGGDAPGMNAAIRAVTPTAKYNRLSVKSINKKYKKKYLKGRIIPGINSEISWHYRAYNLRILVNHANPADLGSTDKKNSGYDSNARIFEPKINWGDEKL